MKKGLMGQIRRRRYIGQQTGAKSGHRPADKPVTNRGPTASFGPPSIPGHALHDKSLQRQQGDGPQVRIQERRSGFVQRTTRMSVDS